MIVTILSGVCNSNSEIASNNSNSNETIDTVNYVTHLLYMNSRLSRTNLDTTARS